MPVGKNAPSRSMAADREQFEADLLEEDENCGSTDCYWTTWY